MEWTQYMNIYIYIYIYISRMGVLELYLASKFDIVLNVAWTSTYLNKLSTQSKGDAQVSTHCMEILPHTLKS
jgi:hypothetical protein